MTFKEHVEENFAKLEAVKQANTPDLMNGGAIRFG